MRAILAMLFDEKKLVTLKCISYQCLLTLFDVDIIVDPIIHRIHRLVVS